MPVWSGPGYRTGFTTEIQRPDEEPNKIPDKESLCLVTNGASLDLMSTEYKSLDYENLKTFYDKIQ